MPSRGLETAALRTVLPGWGAVLGGSGRGEMAQGEGLLRAGLGGLPRACGQDVSSAHGTASLRSGALDSPPRGSRSAGRFHVPLFHFFRVCGFVFVPEDQTRLMPGTEQEGSFPALGVRAAGTM